MSPDFKELDQLMVKARREVFNLGFFTGVFVTFLLLAVGFATYHFCA